MLAPDHTTPRGLSLVSLMLTSCLAALCPGHLKCRRRLLPKLLSTPTVSALRSSLDTVTAGSSLASHDRRIVEMEPEQADDGSLVRRVYEPCTRYGPYRALARSPLLLGIAKGLFGTCDLVYHYSKVNMKPHSVPTQVDWHQDMAVRCSPSHSQVACWGLTISVMLILGVGHSTIRSQTETLSRF